MKTVYQIISFLAFFYVLLFFFDLLLPNDGKTELVRYDLNGPLIIAQNEQSDDELTPQGNTRLSWVESSTVYRQPVRFTYLWNDQVIQVYPKFSIFVQGIAFIFLLTFGAIFGVFFKKTLAMEQRVAIYNCLCGFLILMVYAIS